jgi:hypothetical protein
MQQRDEQRIDRRLLCAFGTAILAGAVGAAIGMGLGILYNKSLPPAPDFGGLRDALIRIFEAAIVGSLIGGNAAFLFMISQLGLWSKISGRIGCAFAGLAVILVIVGGAVCVGIICVLETLG